MKRNLSISLLAACAVAVGISGSWRTSVALAQPSQSSDNPSYFTGAPPRLVKVSTPTNSVNWPLPAYFFTIDLPANAIQSLGQVTIQQQTSPDTIQFDLKKTQAFQGTPHSEKALTINRVTLDSNTQTIALRFDPPVPPGTVLTIQLQAYQNPSTPGVYFFDVKALPAGPNPFPFELGMGRLQFYAPFR